MENMRNYLSPLNPSEALFLGRAFIAPIPGPDSLEILYLHGGSGDAKIKFQEMRIH